MHNNQKPCTIMVENLEVVVQRKAIKNLHLYVLPPQGKVQLSVPHQLSEVAVQQFVLSKLSWIYKQQDRISKTLYCPDPLYQSGDMVKLWGKSYELVVVEAKRPQATQLLADKLYLQVMPESTVIQRQQRLYQWYRQQLKQEIPQLLEHWQQTIGVQVTDWGIKNMKTRWGSCNTQAKRIWLNLQLTRLPLSCLEYVVVHELVHLLERHHNKTFYAYLEKYLPDWQECKALLRINH
jgi:predicted metal-dependent hydrolase